MKPLVRPRFTIGDLVFCRQTGRKGKITDYVNRFDEIDVRTQGYRYYVQIGRDVWSIPEDGLLLEKKANDSELKTQVASFIVPLGMGIPVKEVVSSTPDPLTALLEKEAEARGGGKK